VSPNRQANPSLTNRSVFRDMIKVGIKDRIELTDVDLEMSAVISCLLDIMVRGANILDLPAEIDRKQVVRFAQKYDFVAEIRIITLHLQIGVVAQQSTKSQPTNRDPADIFEIATLLDDHDLCSSALKEAGAGWKWTAGCEPGNEQEFGKSVKGAKAFDLAGGSLRNLQAIPIEIVWALLRASHKPFTSTGAALQAEHDAMAEKYSKLMALKGNSSSSLDLDLG